ncbi:hypothetical protein AX15_002175 [Amanita polypyramis BW_CC]|nr:hypothetical protein AX15_002175 [Amanita polypyramis BW_CC]
MVKISYVILSLIAAIASGAPIQKRIAQVIDQSTAKWEQACLAAGGGIKCNPQSIKSFDTLLAAAKACDQQDEADNMIDLAKSLGNDKEMITLTQIFAQQPRNSPSSQSVQYCDKAPRNSELNGLFQCQFASTDKKTFVGGVPVGSPGTIPFGHQAPVNPPGSCPANPGGPIPDGQQLVIITQTPGIPSAGGDSGKAATSRNLSWHESRAPASSSDFHEDNGKKAQQLNAKFSSLTDGSSCTDGEPACIGDDFAQCANGQFVKFPCSGGLKCFALPLVNKPGTSVACTTEADAQARIAATGVQGGITGA